MGNQLQRGKSTNRSSRDSTKSTNHNFDGGKIRLLVIGYIRTNIPNSTAHPIPDCVETVCSKYYGRELINCIFQCKIDRFGYLENMETANKFDEKKHRRQQRLERQKLMEWQNYLFPPPRTHSEPSPSAISPSVTPGLSPGLSSGSSNGSHSGIPSDSFSPPTATPPLDRSLSIKWDRILESSKLKALVQMGIPGAFRPLMWKNMVGIEAIREIALEMYGEQTLYQDLVNAASSPFHGDIWRDINKTCKNNVRYGLHNYSKEINELTPNSSELYHEVPPSNNPYAKCIEHEREISSLSTTSHQSNDSNHSLNLQSPFPRSHRSHQSQFSLSMSATTISEGASIGPDVSVNHKQNLSGNLNGNFNGNHRGNHPNGRRRKRRTRSVIKRFSHSARSGPILRPGSALLRPRSDSNRRKSASCSNLQNIDQLEGRRYSVTYFKHKVIDSDSVNRCGDRNVNVAELERNATKTQLQLYNVLKSFSLYQRSIGYTSNCGLRFDLDIVVNPSDSVKVDSIRLMP